MMSKNVLIVDDEPAICTIVARILSNNGLQAHTVPSGKAALTKLAENDYDLLIADIKMSGLGGRELYETLKQKRSDMANKTVFITGDTMSKETNDFLVSSGRPYLPKPLTPIELIDIIERTLAEK
ncbi:MAG: response regulator [Chloroflexi bacterium]|nr:response regulator [Chloroflexota bacterium]